MGAETGKARIELSADPARLAERAATWIVERIAASAGMFRIALAGGSTPRGLYAELATAKYCERIDWARFEIFWGDERFVPHDNARSNYRMAHETLLAKAPIPADRIHPILTDGDPESAARDYEAALKRIYCAEVPSSGRPLFQLVLLGLGSDGHTASLFPGDAEVLNERDRWAVPVYSQAEPRITLTYPALQSSAAVAFLVTGEEKAEAVRGVLSGDASLPASHVHPEGQIVWFLDEAAASRLSIDGGL